MANQKVCKKEYLSSVYGVDRKIYHSGSLFGITRASLMMPISDPRNRFFYPHHTPMKDTYFLNENIYCDPSFKPSLRDGFNEGPQFMLILKKKDNNPQLTAVTPSYL